MVGARGRQRLPYVPSVVLIVQRRVNRWPLRGSFHLTCGHVVTFPLSLSLSWLCVRAGASTMIPASHGTRAVDSETSLLKQHTITHTHTHTRTDNILDRQIFKEISERDVSQYLYRSQQARNKSESIRENYFKQIVYSEKTFLRRIFPSVFN